jgi:hypothetical protein
MKFLSFLTLFLLLFVSTIEGKATLTPPTKVNHPPLGNRPYVQGILHNQLGNQLFEIAATVSLAMDNHAQAIFPDLIENKKFKISDNYKYILWRLNPTPPPREPTFIHHYHDVPYEELPYQPDMVLSGIFQSENFFVNHKNAIINLFSPHKNIVDYIYKKHGWLKNNPKTVAVHVRAYWPYFPGGWPDGKDVLPFLGYHYFEKAILKFPTDYIFVVFSDNISWCKENLNQIPRTFIFVENQPHYIDFYMMGLCRHNIISNSSYSWWGAYLNRNPDKIVIGPKHWFTPESNLDSRDILPKTWISLE